MGWHFSASSFIYIITGTITLVAAWINWRQRQQQGVFWLALALLFISLWAFCGTLETAAVSIDDKVALTILANFLGGTFANLILFFVIDYYHRAAWLPAARRVWLWFPVIVFTLFSVTNSLHNLVWLDFIAGPPGSNLIYYQHGPGYVLVTGYSVLQFAAIILILGREAVRSPGRDRWRAVWMILSFVLPFISWWWYIHWSGQAMIVDIMPIGFAASGLLISWIVFEDLQIQVNERTLELQNSVQSLQSEIQVRLQLENELRQIQESLAGQLADQSHKLSGLYDMILFSGQTLNAGELLDKALEIIQSVTGSDIVCFYRKEPEFLQLQAQRGLDDVSQKQLERMPSDWLGSRRDAQAHIDVTRSPELPVAIHMAGIGSSLCKYVSTRDQILGILCNFWKTPHSMGVEEIALFGALADALGIGLENTRLRQESVDSARQQERRRLARDLHDSVTQSLHSLVFSAETAGQVIKAQPERAEKSLAHLIVSAQQALKEMRLLLYELRLVPLEEIHLIQAIQSRLETVELRANVKGHLQVEPGANWPKEWEVELFPIIMEALNNSLKYGRATQIEVSIAGDTEQLILVIKDDGCGFDLAQLTPGGLGLQSMAERAERLGGTLDIRTGRGLGTEIRIQIDHCPDPNLEVVRTR